MPSLTRRRVIALSLLALAGCESNPEGPKAPPPPEPGTVKMPTAAPGVLKKTRKKMDDANAS